MAEIIVQTIKKEYDDRLKTGIAYYTFISAINNIRLTEREIQLLAFINYRGTISSASAREEFCKIFGSSIGTISNMVSKRLIPLRLLVKEKSKIRISPPIRIDFSNDLIIRLFLNTKKEEQDADNQ